MKKKSILVLCLLMTFNLTACRLDYERELMEDEQNLPYEAPVDDFEDNLDIDYDATAEYMGNTYYKIADKCYEDIELNPIGVISLKCYEPEEGITDRGILIRLLKDGDVIATLRSPDEYENIGCRATIDRIEFVDFNNDGFGDIIIVEDDVNVTYDEEGNEIIADNYLVRLHYGDEHGSLICGEKFEKAVNNDLSEYDTESILTAIEGRLYMLED